MSDKGLGKSDNAPPWGCFVGSFEAFSEREMILATRTRKTWKPGKDGQFTRQLGWKHGGKSGKLVQIKFRLGSDLKEAKRREMMLQQLWEYVERQAGEGQAVWPSDILELAKQIARGDSAKLCKVDFEHPSEYAVRVARLQADLPMVPIHPDDEAAFNRGRAWSQSHAKSQIKSAIETAEKIYRPFISVFGSTPSEEGPALHEAIREHIAWLKEEYRDSEGSTTAWGRTRIKQVEILLDRHQDIPLSRLDYDAIEGMVRYWRQRPNRKGTTEPITKKSAENFIAALKGFCKWLSRSRKFDWKKPEDFDDIRSRVKARAGDTRPQVTPEDVFSLDELVLLNTYATPLERFLLLLGINCGFGRAEIASLLVGEVHLRQAHDPRHREMLNFNSSDGDSFIKRYRRKTGVYGEFILFPQTVQAIEWALERRKKQPDFGPNARLLLNDRGEPYDKPTKGGNANQQIANRFADLIRRIRNDGKLVDKRPFKMLRKTAGDLVRRFSDGEVAAVFHSRGQPVEIDDLADAYTNRPFGKVFETIRNVEDYLNPMFEAGGTTPFTAGPQAYTSHSVIQRISQLQREGMSVPKIAEAADRHPSTVYRLLRRTVTQEG